MRSNLTCAVAPKPAATALHSSVQPLLHLLLHARAERPHCAHERGLARHDAHRAEIAGTHRADADHCGIDGSDIARHNALYRRDDVRGHHHRIDREVGMRAMSALACDFDRDAVGRGHHRAAIDAHGARRHPRPVVHRIHRLDREAIEQPVLDHHPRAGEAFLARLEDQHRGAVEVAVFPRDSAPRRQASRCGRHVRSRASVHSWMIATRIRCLRTSATHPCRRAGRSCDRWPSSCRE